MNCSSEEAVDALSPLTMTYPRPTPTHIRRIGGRPLYFLHPGAYRYAGTSVYSIILFSPR